jgi:hypothetical protein
LGTPADRLPPHPDLAPFLRGQLAIWARRVRRLNDFASAFKSFWPARLQRAHSRLAVRPQAAK